MQMKLNTNLDRNPHGAQRGSGTKRRLNADVDRNPNGAQCGSVDPELKGAQCGSGIDLHDAGNEWCRMRLHNTTSLT